MPADRLLITLLRHLQTYSSQQDTPRLLATATSLLTTLSNPRNLTLLTSQLLSSPAIWERPDGLRTCLRFIGVYQGAAVTILRHEEEQSRKDEVDDTPKIGGGLSRDEWVKAVLHGADDRSPTWRHSLVLAGLLIGYEGQDAQGLSRNLRATLEAALVKAVNLAMEEMHPSDEIGPHAIALALNYSFELLSDLERSRLDYDRLLPVLVGPALFSREGYQSAYFLVDSDVLQTTSEKFTWSENSASFGIITDIMSRPLVSTMGTLSRLIAHTVENIRDSLLVETLMDDLITFSETLLFQWRRNKISEVDISEEAIFFDETALSKTLPGLWKLLRSVLFSLTIILRGVMGRLLGDRQLASHKLAPLIATKSLHVLRNLYFIASRIGPNTLTQYSFVYLTAIDVLSAYAAEAQSFIESIAPASLGQIPPHPLDRNLDLYFLNTAEHFTLALPPKMNDELLIAAAVPYLAAGGNNHLLEIFEAAHSVMLAVLSSPQSADLAANHLPFYVGALFNVFPANLSARQFRLAFKTLVRITTPPAPLAATHPELPEILLELLHERALAPPKREHRPAPYTAPVQRNPPTSPNASPTSSANTTKPEDASDESSIAVDERTTLVLTLIDSLPFLPVPLLEEWLPLAAELIPKLDTPIQRQKCQHRFWEVLSSGEMDVDRSQVCVAWWATRDGREMVLHGDIADAQYQMSGALALADAPRSSGSSDSKL